MHYRINLIENDFCKDVDVQMINTERRGMIYVCSQNEIRCR